MPFPTAGRGNQLSLTNLCKGCAVVYPSFRIPDIGRFMARAAAVVFVEAALAKTSLSQVAHATDGFTHGRVYTGLTRRKGHMSFRKHGRV
jgi:hypothetical protein